ncbi:MAG: sensor histidine kinase N-terminal domain-containing protein [Proteobacteria bacterium]|nr:sensor histidine kinase N-terminal domain-containing protein [Pseudomonadota bacterium]
MANTPEIIADEEVFTPANGLKRQEKPARSLRARLIGLLLLAVLVIGALQAGVAYRTARAETETVFDAQMARVALSLSGGMAASVLSDAPLLLGEGTQDFIIQIWRADGLMLYRTPTARLLPPQAVIGFSDLRAGGTDYRVYALRTPTQVVQVAQGVATRRQVAGQLALRAVLPVVLLAPLLMLIVWGVVSRALAPLARVQGQVAARQPGDLAPLSTDGLPAELRPLVAEMNQLLARLAAAWDALQHFTSDAAHELRSPLAALRLQAQSLQRADGPEARQIATERLLAGIDRATRLVEQLLALARQEGSASAAPQVAVDLAVLARAAVADAAPEAARRGVALSLDAPTAVPAQGQPEALAVLLRNLIDNALRHTPAQAQVRVGVRAADAGAGPSLVVEDAGPGIPPEERARVLDRFYRVPGSPGHGSGLGLAIVRAIAERHGARLVLEDSATLGGLRVEMGFPAARDFVPGP